MTRLFAPLVLLLLLAGCDSGGAEDPPRPPSVAGVWKGTIEQAPGWDIRWTGTVTLDIRQPDDRPFGRAVWTDGTVTLPGNVEGFVPVSGAISLSVDHGSRGTINYTLQLDGDVLSGTWINGHNTGINGTARLVRQ